ADPEPAGELCVIAADVVAAAVAGVVVPLPESELLQAVATSNAGTSRAVNTMDGRLDLLTSSPRCGEWPLGSDQRWNDRHGSGAGVDLQVDLDKPGPIDRRVGVQALIVEGVDVVGDVEGVATPEVRVFMGVVGEHIRITVATGRAGFRHGVERSDVGERTLRTAGDVASDGRVEGDRGVLGDGEVAVAVTGHAHLVGDVAQDARGRGLLGGPVGSGPIPPAGGAGQVTTDDLGQVQVLFGTEILHSVDENIAALPLGPGTPLHVGRGRQRQHSGALPGSGVEPDKVVAVPAEVEDPRTELAELQRDYVQGLSAAGGQGAAEPVPAVRIRRWYEGLRVVGGSTLDGGQPAAALHHDAVVDERARGRPAPVRRHRAEEGVGEDPGQPAAGDRRRVGGVAAGPAGTVRAAGVAVGGEPRSACGVHLGRRGDGGPGQRTASVGGWLSVIVTTGLGGHRCREQECGGAEQGGDGPAKSRTDRAWHGLSSSRVAAVRGCVAAQAAEWSGGWTAAMTSMTSARWSCMAVRAASTRPARMCSTISTCSAKSWSRSP